MERREIHDIVGFSSLGIAVVSMPYSIFVCHISLGFYVLNWILAWNWKEKYVVLAGNPLVWLLPAFFLLHLVGMAYTENMAKGWEIIETKAFLVLLPITIASSAPLSSRRLDQLSMLFVGSCVVGTFICLGHAVGVSQNHGPFLNFGEPTGEIYNQLNPGSSSEWMYFSYVNLASGIQMHPTYLGLYLILCILILIFPQEASRSWHGVKAVLIVYLSVFIVFLSSRIILVVLVGVLALAAVLAFAQAGKTLKITAAITAVVVIACAVYLNPISRYRTLQEPSLISFEGIPPSLAENSMDIRSSLWWLGKKSLTEINFWLGAGTGDVNVTMQLASDRYNKHNILNSTDPHNEFLYVGIGLGALGLALFAACLVVPLIVGYRRRCYLLMGFTVVFAVVCLTESALELQKGIVAFSLFTSLFLFQREALVATPQRFTYA